MVQTIELSKYIVANPEICHGKPTFKGTRIMVWQVLEMLAAGEGMEDILKDFPSITRIHIAEALEYAARLAEGWHVLPLAHTRHHEALSR